MQPSEIKAAIEAKVFEAYEHDEESHTFHVIMQQVKRLQQDFVSAYNATHDGTQTYAFIEDGGIVVRTVGYTE